MLLPSELIAVSAGDREPAWQAASAEPCSMSHASMPRTANLTQRRYTRRVLPERTWQVTYYPLLPRPISWLHVRIRRFL